MNAPNQKDGMLEKRNTLLKILPKLMVVIFILLIGAAINLPDFHAYKDFAVIFKTIMLIGLIAEVVMIVMWCVLKKSEKNK